MSSHIRVSAVIPACNEKDSIVEVIKVAAKFVDETVVVDNCSTDGTGEVARFAGARVVLNQLTKDILVR